MSGSWEAERRLDFIDFRMLTARCIRRTDIMRVFGVSMSQASADLNRFLRAYPRWLLYDRSKKWYYPHAEYRTRRGINLKTLQALALLWESGHPMSWI